MGTEQSEFPQTAKGCFFMCQKDKALLQPLFYRTPASPLSVEETKEAICPGPPMESELWTRKSEDPGSPGQGHREAGDKDTWRG